MVVDATLPMFAKRSWTLRPTCLSLGCCCWLAGVDPRNWVVVDWNGTAVEGCPDMAPGERRKLFKSLAEGHVAAAGGPSEAALALLPKGKRAAVAAAAAAAGLKGKNGQPKRSGGSCSQGATSNKRPRKA